MSDESFEFMFKGQQQVSGTQGHRFERRGHRFEQQGHRFERHSIDSSIKGLDSSVESLDSSFKGINSSVEDFDSSSRVLIRAWRAANIVSKRLWASEVNILPSSFSQRRSHALQYLITLIEYSKIPSSFLARAESSRLWRLSLI